jgi:hypothetical protein
VIQFNHNVVPSKSNPQRFPSFIARQRCRRQVVCFKLTAQVEKMGILNILKNTGSADKKISVEDASGDLIT